MAEKQLGLRRKWVRSLGVERQHTLRSDSACSIAESMSADPQWLTNDVQLVCDASEVEKVAELQQKADDSATAAAGLPDIDSSDTQPKDSQPSLVCVCEGALVICCCTGVVLPALDLPDSQLYDSLVPLLFVNERARL